MSTMILDTTPANDSPAVLAIGCATEVAGYRVHRFTISLRVTELANAGKRCREWAIIERGFGPLACGESLALEIIMCARRGAAHVERALSEASECGYVVEARELRGVDVTPASSRVRVVGMHVVVDADAEGFTVRDADDVANETTIMGRTRTATKRFLAWAHANRDALRGMYFRDVLAACRAEGIDVHQWCAVD